MTCGGNYIFIFFTFLFMYDNKQGDIGDGAYDSKDNFRYLDIMGIELVVGIRNNSSTRANGCISKKMVVIEQMKDME
jgi:hypothetical protein